MLIIHTLLPVDMSWFSRPTCALCDAAQMNSTRKGANIHINKTHGETGLADVRSDYETTQRSSNNHFNCSNSKEIESNKT